MDVFPLRSTCNTRGKDSVQSTQSKGQMTQSSVPGDTIPLRVAPVIDSFSPGYSAALSSEPGNATSCRRGGIAGRWTKPVAATRLAASRGTPI